MKGTITKKKERGTLRGVITNCTITEKKERGTLRGAITNNERKDKARGKRP